MNDAMSCCAEYLVNHGRAAYLGRFAHRAEGTFHRGAKVVIRSMRGVEIGTVLGESPAALAHLVDRAASGELLRRASDADERRFDELSATAERIREDAQSFIDSSSLPLTILDVEILLDGVPVIMQMLPLGECDLEALGQTLSSRLGLEITIQDMRVAPTVLEPTAPGCGKPGCGSSAGGCNSCGTGGGCGTNSCSRTAVKNPQELTAYFAGLRQQLERASERIPLADGRSGN